MLRISYCELTVFLLPACSNQYQLWWINWDHQGAELISMVYIWKIARKKVLTYNILIIYLIYRFFSARSNYLFTEKHFQLWLVSCRTKKHKVNFYFHFKSLLATAICNHNNVLIYRKMKSRIPVLLTLRLTIHRPMEYILLNICRNPLSHFAWTAYQICAVVRRYQAASKL